MSEQSADVMSQHGWLRVDFNQAVWIPCLPVFLAGYDRRSWAALYAEQWWEASGIEYHKRQVTDLRRTLEHIHEITYSQLPCHMALIHLPDPRLAPLLVAFGIWQAAGDRDEQLRRLAQVEEPQAIQPPIIETCTTDRLGTGLKVLSHLQVGKGPGVTGYLNYAWRSEEYQTAVRMFTQCPDLGRLQRAMPDIDALTEVLSFVARNPRS